MKLRFDTLFARLLLLQVGVAIALVLVFGALVYVERNIAVARLVAERWAPTLRAATGTAEPPPAPLRALQRSDVRPEGAWRAQAPRIAALQDELRRQGLLVHESVIARGAGGPMLWLHLRTSDGASGWYGVADNLLLPRIPGRLMLALLISATLLVWVSWYFTRRLTRPLERLRASMVSHRPGEPVHGTAPLAGASPEVAAIAHAYNDLLQRLERHERERALLLAGVSHDLRSPLARIRMAAGLLPEDAVSAPWREAIVRNTQVADRLIESFLDHVRAGELTLDQEADLAELARAAAAATGHAADALQVEAPDALRLQQTHPVLIERLVANLLDNAFKHGRAPVRLSVRPEAPHAVLEVSDAGSGMPALQRESLMQAFSRGDAARGKPGTGLGLAIVARVVARMGGTIHFVQRDGRHVVRVALPLRRSP
jgi:two-component system, OmpR family, osmolarity sensor histidine kinase EnvZ